MTVRVCPRLASGRGMAVVRAAPLSAVFLSHDVRPCWQPQNHFFCLVPVHPLFLALLSSWNVRVCLVKDIHISLITAHSLRSGWKRCQEPGPEVAFFSNHHGWRMNLWEPGTSSLCQRAGRGLWGLLIQSPHFTGTETEAQRWRVTAFLKIDSWLASPESLHPWLWLLFLAHFSIEYKHFSRT